MTAPQPSVAPGAPTDGGTGGQAPTDTQPQNTPAPAATETQDVSQLPAWAQKLITDTRTEAAKHRTDKQTATQAAAEAKAQRDAALKAFGLNADGTDVPADPAALTAAVELAQSAAWSTAVENQVLRTKDIDADRLLDSRAFIDSLDPFADEDPSTADFKTKLAAHVKAYVGKHPNFKATSAGPARSGGDMTPGAPATPPTRPKSLMDAVSKHFKT